VARYGARALERPSARHGAGSAQLTPAVPCHKGVHPLSQLALHARRGAGLSSLRHVKVKGKNGGNLDRSRIAVQKTLNGSQELSLRTRRPRPKPESKKGNEVGPGPRERRARRARERRAPRARERRMGNNASSTLAGSVETLNCCTAVDGVDDVDDADPHGSGRRRFQGKADRNSLCRDLTGESLFTDCIDDRCGTDRPRRFRQGMPGEAPANTYGDGGREPVL